MAELRDSIEQSKSSIQEFVTHARQIPPERWSAPVAPGKWSPAQITEHVAIGYELGLKMLHGEPVDFRVPKLIRPLLRRFFLAPTLRKGRFPKGGRAPKAFHPSPTPGGQSELLARLERSSAALETEMERAGQSGKPNIVTTGFGEIPSADYLQLQAIHVTHHRAHLP